MGRACNSIQLQPIVHGTILPGRISRGPQEVKRNVKLLLTDFGKGRHDILGIAEGDLEIHPMFSHAYYIPHIAAEEV